MDTPAIERDTLRTQLLDGIAALGLTLPADAPARLLDYLALLQRWNAAYNLTAVRDPAQMVTRHLLDSLAIAPFVQGDTLADLGSGAGLPGIPLAIAAPQRVVTLVDTNGKKARFLREAARTLDLANVRVAQQRVEDVAGRFDCITARAFASLADMLAWGGHLLADNGRWLAMKGRYPDDELAALPPGFRLRAAHRLRVPGLDAERHLLALTHL
jgi:16S rRNA (guanine527-N7)-methyltransferase